MGICNYFKGLEVSAGRPRDRRELVVEEMKSGEECFDVEDKEITSRQSSRE